jgi:DNA polymerase elongation subunit (family B)
VDKVLIYDIECATASARPDAEKDEFKVFGCYSYVTNKYSVLKSLDSVKKALASHVYLVGFNNLLYDNNVLKRAGFEDRMFEFFNNKYQAFQYYFHKKYNIDLFQVIDKRAGIIVVENQGGKQALNEVLVRNDLGSVAEALGTAEEGKRKIKDFDYSLLRKDSWTPKEWKRIRQYTLRDVELTKRLYEWLEDYFENFKELLLQKDVKSKKYITCSPSAFAYKALCKQLGLEEEYEEVEETPTYGGGYVAYPAGESFDETQGSIYLLDFDSLYPHVNFQCNLFSPSEQGWNGNGKFKVTGVYDDKRMGLIEQFLFRTFNRRQEYKMAEDPREHAFKIVLNSIYGISSTRRFKHAYREHTASDCTSLGRQWVMLARKRFREAGYENIFSDTDSVCLLDTHQDKKRLLKVKGEVIEEIKANVPFPSKTFDMSIEDEISNIWFFKARQKKGEEDRFMDEDDYKNRKKRLLKKNYIYLTKEGKIVVKNLGVRKKSTSQLTRHIFWDILVPKIKAEKGVKFSKSFLEETIEQVLRKDLSLAAVRYSVKPFESYKKESQLQAQIAQEYGPGIHFMIPNTQYGVGKGKKKRYCTAEEFKQKNFSLKDINLQNVWSELSYFIEEEPITIFGLEIMPFVSRVIARLITR